MQTGHGDIVELWVDRAPGAPLLVLLHGYGQNEHELAGAAAGLQGYAVVALRGLRDLAADESPFATTTSGSFTWVLDPQRYPVHYPMHFPLTDFPARGFAETVSRLRSWIRAQRADYPDIHLAGFSQGGIVAGEIVRSDPGVSRSLSLLSSFTLTEPGPADGDLAGSDFPIFFSHGTADEVIGQSAFARTSTWAAAHGALTDRTYAGMHHQMTCAVADDWKAFLGSLI